MSKLAIPPSSISPSLSLSFSDFYFSNLALTPNSSSHFLIDSWSSLICLYFKILTFPACCLLTHVSPLTSSNFQVRTLKLPWLFWFHQQVPQTVHRKIESSRNMHKGERSWRSSQWLFWSRSHFELISDLPNKWFSHLWLLLLLLFLCLVSLSILKIPLMKLWYSYFSLMIRTVRVYQLLG